MLKNLENPWENNVSSASHALHIKFEQESYARDHMEIMENYCKINVSVAGIRIVPWLVHFRIGNLTPC